jgi:hypothetical protein
MHARARNFFHPVRSGQSGNSRAGKRVTRMVDEFEDGRESIIMDNLGIGVNSEPNNETIVMIQT